MFWSWFHLSWVLFALIINKIIPKIIRNAPNKSAKVLYVGPGKVVQAKPSNIKPKMNKANDINTLFCLDIF